MQRLAARAINKFVRSTLVCVGLACSSSFGASFECAKARNAREKAVCADTELSKLDDALAVAYRRLLPQLSPTAQREVVKNQNVWLTWLEKVCLGWDEVWHDDPDRNLKGCLAEHYDSRIGELRGGGRHDGLVWVPRAELLTVANPPNDSDPHFPDIGIRELVWVEIDRPTASQAGFNEALRSRMLGFATAGEDLVQLDGGIEGNSGKLMQVLISGLFYGYGAAHPNTYSERFQWWINSARELNEEDVFRPNSGWEQFLATRAAEELRDTMFRGTPIESVANYTYRVSGWWMDRTKLSVTIPHDVIAPHSAGDLTVDYKWSELKPYLVGGFDPSSLPAPSTTQ